ncbi:MAG: ATP-binding protein [Kyrpidia sp.]|nr:ATP-binding protein [Kyrpidia sp.]
MFHREGWIERNIELLPFPACIADGGGALLAVNRALEDMIQRSLRQAADSEEGLETAVKPDLFAKMVRYERATPDGERIFLYIAEDRANWDIWLWHLMQPFVGEMATGLILVNSDLHIRAVNRTAVGMLGLEPEQAIGRAIHEAIPELGVVLRPVAHKLTTENLRNMLFDVEIDGQIKHCLLDTRVVDGYGGSDDRKILLFLTDIGERFDSQIQRQEKLATVGKIAAGIAHEIRNPLTSIRGFLQIMRQNFIRLRMEKEFQYTEVMLAEIDRVNELVGELLLLSKPRDMKLEPVEVEELITGLAPLISSETILHDIEFHLCIKPVPKVLADSEMLKQVVVNLVKNAVEAMEHGGTLTICTRVVQDEDLVQIDVQDTGPGIPNYVMDRIFDAFFTTKENGTGLGLPICQRIISDLGGTIRVSSKGYGTTFTVLLPAYREK